MNTEMFCTTCEKNNDTYKDKIAKSYTIKSISIDTTVEVVLCSVCDSVIDCKENRKEILTAVRENYEKKFSYTPNFLKDVRVKTNLNTFVFSKLFGIEEKTLNRFENGQLAPDINQIEIYKKIDSDKNYILNLLSEKESIFSHEEKKLISDVLSV